VQLCKPWLLITKSEGSEDKSSEEKDASIVSVEPIEEEHVKEQPAKERPAKGEVKGKIWQVPSCQSACKEHANAIVLPEGWCCAHKKMSPHKLIYEVCSLVVWLSREQLGARWIAPVFVSKFVSLSSFSSFFASSLSSLPLFLCQI
jgi:hypothetical protein